MRPIDADFAKERIRKSDLTNREKIALMLVLEDIPTLAPPPNDPLTLEELREMSGEPVWVVELNGYPPHWGLVYWCRKSKRNIVYVTINNGASICAEAFLTVGGKIYRRRPEEGMA